MTRARPLVIRRPTDGPPSDDFVLPYWPVLDAEATGRVGVNVIDYRPHVSFGPESHPAKDADGRDELWIICGGSADVELDAERYAVAAGDVVWVPAGVKHLIEAGAEGFRFYGVSLPLHRRRPLDPAVTGLLFR